MLRMMLMQEWRALMLVLITSLKNSAMSNAVLSSSPDTGLVVRMGVVLGK